MSIAQPILQISGLSFGYPKNDRSVGPMVVRDLSINLRRDETVCILGPSGCGKTTILKIAASLLTPSLGTVRVAGEVVEKPGPERIVVFQDQDQLFPWKTVIQNVMFPLEVLFRSKTRCLSDRVVHPSPLRDIGERAQTALNEVELVGVNDRFPHELSGGMRQRVALARAVVIEPPILLLDEPFASVDAPTRERLGTLLRRLQLHYNLAILFVTHDVEEALRVGDRIVVLGRDGTVDITIENVREQVDADRSAELLKKRIRTVLER